jgi:hypothetical protein
MYALSITLKDEHYYFSSAMHFDQICTTSHGAIQQLNYTEKETREKEKKIRQVEKERNWRETITGLVE